MRLNVTEFSSKQFSWKDGVGVADASDLGDNHLQSLYDDAFDAGLAVKSHKTGDVVIFVATPFYLIVHGVNTDLIGWNYVPTGESIRKVPSCKGTKLIVYND